MKEEEERERQFNNLSEEIRKLTNGISQNNIKINGLRRQIRNLEHEIQVITENLANRNSEHEKLESFKDNLKTTYDDLASTEPNLQNIPVRTEEGRQIRDCFIAQKPYTELLTADYSQIEMRIMAHLSNDEGLIAAFESGEDLHSTVGAQVFNVKPSEVDAEMRRTIKAMSYGLAYGLSAFGLSQQLDIDPTEAGELMDKYFERFGGIRDYLKSVVIEARDKGYTETILGRRRYLPDLKHEIS